MFKRFVLILISVLASAGAALALCACQDKETETFVPPVDDNVYVTVVDSDEFEITDSDSRTFKADENGVVRIAVRTEFPYYVAGVTCLQGTANKFISEQPELGKTIVRLRNISRSMRIKLDIGTEKRAVLYDMNGGALADGRTVFRVRYELKKRLYPNTVNGVDIIRDGYTAVGWNTMPDGSGTHVGLGSRITFTEDSLTLYAEWKKWDDPGDYDHTVNDDGTVTVTKYKANRSTAVVPCMIDGKPVTRIASRAFENKSVNTVVFPNTLVEAEIGAFYNCLLKELYICDNIEKISDDAFILCSRLTTLHINAVTPPKYTTYDRHSTLADKYDLLIKRDGRPKIIIFSGCSAYFSVSATQIEAAYNGHVDAVNLAINGWFNGVAQFEMMLPYVKEGDILIHMPEASSNYQLLASNDMTDQRIFRGLELNYDLFTNVDLRHVTGTFDSFAKFLEERAERDPESYTAVTDYMNSDGDYGRKQPQYGTDEAISKEADINVDYLRLGTVELNAMYDRFRAKGVGVFTGNAVVNRHGLIERFGSAEKVNHRVAEYDEEFAWLINAESLVSLADCVYDGKYFFDTDYHLGDPKKKEHTAKILQALKDSMKGREAI